jgi:hypothetical protein
MRITIAICAFALAIPAFAASSATAGAAAGSEIRGKLVQPASGPVSLDTGSVKIEIKADNDSNSVLHDPRLAPLDIALHGHLIDPTHFQLDPFYQKPIWAVKNGKEMLVTYYCDVCSIRYYTPGRCVCCQQETRVDLHDDSAEAKSKNK